MAAMYYIGITVNLTEISPESLKHTGLQFSQVNNIIYARKCSNKKDLLIPANELETLKGHIRRLPAYIYDKLNDDWGLHIERARPIIKKRET